MVALWLLLDEGMKFPWAGGDARSTASICWLQRKHIQLVTPSCHLLFQHGGSNHPPPYCPFLQPPAHSYGPRTPPQMGLGRGQAGLICLPAAPEESAEDVCIHVLGWDFLPGCARLMAAGLSGNPMPPACVQPK